MTFFLSVYLPLLPIYSSASTENTHFSISGRGQRYSWSSTWWLLSPHCWRYRRKKRETVYFWVCVENFKKPSWKWENSRKTDWEETFRGVKSFTKSQFFSKSFHEKFLKRKVINEKFPRKVSNEKFWEILETVYKILLKDIKGAPQLTAVSSSAPTIRATSQVRCCLTHLFCTPAFFSVFSCFSSLYVLFQIFSVPVPSVFQYLQCSSTFSVPVSPMFLYLQCSCISSVPVSPAFLTSCIFRVPVSSKADRSRPYSRSFSCWWKIACRSPDFGYFRAVLLEEVTTSRDAHWARVLWIPRGLTPSRYP